MSEVAATQRAELERLHLEPEVARRVAMTRPRAERAPLMTAWRSLGLAAAGAAVAVLVVLGTRPDRLASLLPGERRAAPLTFTVAEGGADRPGLVGDEVAAPVDRATATRFSDGSEVVVAAGGRARIVALEAAGAAVMLEEGRVDVHVVHRAETRWEVRAGDFHVRVTGTRFAVTWRAPSRGLQVRLYEGAVAVSGPGLGPEGRRVQGGQELRVDPTGATLALVAPTTSAHVTAVAAEAEARAESEAEGTSPDTTDATAATDAGPPARRTVVAHVARPASPSRRPSHRRAASTSGGAPGPGVAPAPASGSGDWHTLATRGQYHGALQAALAQDFGDACRRFSPADLMLLGDVARLDGDAVRSEQAYRSALQRFPAFDRPSFSLGVLAFEARRDYHAAAGWFTRYLREHPSGPLATEAAGRLLESLHRGGETDRARAAAASYLREHPGGPQTALARALARP